MAVRPCPARGARRLRADLDAVIEEERRAERGAPEHEAKVWLKKLSGAEVERRGYQRLAVKGLVTDLEETREVAEHELTSLRSRRKRVEQMERGRDILLEGYAHMAPETLDDLSSEKRHQIHRMLEPRAAVKMGGALRSEVRS